MSRSELTLSGGFIFPTSPSLLPAPFHLAGTESTMPKPKSKETLALDDEAIFAAAGSGEGVAVGKAAKRKRFSMA